MARVIRLSTARAARRVARHPAGSTTWREGHAGDVATAEVVLFPGVRYEYLDGRRRLSTRSRCTTTTGGADREG